jgi:hypothetical protein
VSGQWTGWLNVSHYADYPGESGSLQAGYQVAVNPT